MTRKPDGIQVCRQLNNRVVSSETAKVGQNKYEFLKLVACLFSLFLLLTLCSNFSGYDYFPVLDQEELYLEEYSWWGLKSEYFLVEWRYDPDFDYAQWMFKDLNKWYPLFTHADPMDYFDSQL